MTKRNRPCFCDICAKGGPKNPGDCPLCWAYYNEPRYHAIWGGPPNLLGMIFDFGKALLDYHDSGYKEVDEETHRYRLQICEECPEFNSQRRSCNLCGCNMDMKAKMAVIGCPVHKWKKIDESTNSE